MPATRSGGTAGSRSHQSRRASTRPCGATFPCGPSRPRLLGGEIVESRHHSLAWFRSSHAARGRTLGKRREARTDSNLSRYGASGNPGAIQKRKGRYSGGRVAENAGRGCRPRGNTPHKVTRRLRKSPSGLTRRPSNGLPQLLLTTPSVPTASRGLARFCKRSDDHGPVALQRPRVILQLCEEPRLDLRCDR